MPRRERNELDKESTMKAEERKAQRRGSYKR
jgi:hypothetical protein